MKNPQRPPDFHVILREPRIFERMARLLTRPRTEGYVHWDKLRRQPPPEGFLHEEWWAAIKVGRMQALKPLPLYDKRGMPFQFSTPDEVAKQLHEIDMGAGGKIGMPEQVTNPHMRDQYLVSSLMQEAITSSQLEGAVTTRVVAKEMLRTGRAPRDKSERMIMNNYRTMRRIIELRDQPLSLDLVFEIHRIVTEGTLDKTDAAGRFRRGDEPVTVGNITGEVFHYPPHAVELPERMRRMCDFANAKSPEFFIHPVVRAILLHFWIGYDHPFLDGNGRTARALFYWAMLNNGYWLFEFISISDVLRHAPAKYYRAFLHSETDDNDATYFIVHQADVIRQAIQTLHGYIDRKTRELQESELLLGAAEALNHRQIALISHALRHPGMLYTVEGHQHSHKTAYDTARRDLLNLADSGFLSMRKRARTMIFAAPADLHTRIEKQASVDRSDQDSKS